MTFTTFWFCKSAWQDWYSELLSLFGGSSLKQVTNQVWVNSVRFTLKLEFFFHRVKFGRLSSFCQCGVNEVGPLPALSAWGSLFCSVLQLQIYSASQPRLRLYIQVMQVLRCKHLATLLLSYNIFYIDHLSKRMSSSENWHCQMAENSAS